VRVNQRRDFVVRMTSLPVPLNSRVKLVYMSSKIVRRVGLVVRTREMRIV